MRHIYSALIISILLGFNQAEAHTFKMATLAPNGSTWMEEIHKAADKISKQTDGRVKFKFYTGGIMGSAKSVLKKIRINQLHGGALTAGDLAEIYPDIQIYGLPFLFRSYAEVDYVRDKMDGVIRKGMKKQGMVLLGISDGGFAYFMSDTPVSAVNALRNKKVWLPEGDEIIQTAYEIIGIAPVPLSLADVYTGLQTGMIDTIGTSPIGALAFQWHTRLKYVSDIPLIYLTGNLVIDQKAFNKISPRDQAIVLEVMNDAMTTLGKINRDNEEQARLALQKQGINFISISREEWQRSENYAKQAIEVLGKKGVYTADMYHLLQTHLNNFRRRNLSQGQSSPSDNANQ